MVHELYTNSDMKRLLFVFLSVCCATAHAQFSNVNIGDIININGTKAIVYQVDETGSHGTAMSINCLRGVSDSWCNNSKLGKILPPMLDERDGKANTQVVLDFASQRNALSSFPVFEWCTKLGDGWYVPSLKELEAFVNYWLGNEQTIDWDAEEEIENQIDESKPYYKQINMKIVEAGGIPFLNGVFTSTVTSDGKVYVFQFDRQKNTWSFKKASKNNLSKYFVGRAFYKF